MDDVRVVMDAVGSRRAALLGFSEGGPLAPLFAATYPERTAALVVLGSGLQFEGRGAYTLKGVPERWRLYAVARLSPWGQQDRSLRSPGEPAPAA